MDVAKLKSLGLDRRLAYKLKDVRNRELFCFRYSETEHCWLDTVHPGTRRHGDEVVSLLSIVQTAGLGEIVPFACCCRRCHTLSQVQAARDLFIKSGDMVSHGYWPECQPRVLAELRAELAATIKIAA